MKYQEIKKSLREIYWNVLKNNNENVIIKIFKRYKYNIKLRNNDTKKEREIGKIFEIVIIFALISPYFRIIFV